MVTPLPDSGMERAPSGSVLSIVKMVEATPATVGLKVTVRARLAPGVRVTGRVGPLTANPAPAGLTESPVTSRSPVP